MLQIIKKFNAFSRSYSCSTICSTLASQRTWIAKGRGMDLNPQPRHRTNAKRYFFIKMNDTIRETKAVDLKPLVVVDIQL